MNEQSALHRGFAKAPAGDIAERIAARHIRTVSRAISWIENGDPGIGLVLDGMIARAGRAMVVGVTGVPGAGKSTLVPALARHLAGDGRQVAILAVDPSSPLTGGAILGDRIRDTSQGEAGIFFRSVASRGSLGGLSRTLDDVVTLLDVAGFDAILIETVGTGQSEVAVTRLAHTTLMATAPGLGDEIQAMKAGILEVADILVVNKADSDPRGAEAAAMTLRQAISETLRAHGLKEGANGEGDSAAWLAPVRAVSALKGAGVAELAELVIRHRAFLEGSPGLDVWRRRRLADRFAEALRDALARRLRDDFAAEHAEALAGVEERAVSPRAAAEKLAARLMRAGPHG